MRRSALLLLALAAGCASGSIVQSSDTAPKQATIFTSPETGTLMTEPARAAAVDIDSPPTTVWLAVKKVYADLDIPVTLENPPEHRLGNPNFFKSRNMGGASMTNWVDCGSGMTGPNALTWRIFMMSLTDVIPNGKGGTTLKTTFTAIGQDVTGGSADRIPCGTTGRFEQSILNRVKLTLGKA
jgi:hypothetical protein